jgi:uncharacterized RDD family membrane protein YckC
LDLIPQLMLGYMIGWLSILTTGIPELATYLAYGAALVILVGYPIAIEYLMRGRSLGKAIVGLRVVTSLGGPIKFRHAAVRGIVGLFEVYASFGAVATVVSFFSPRSQRLGDMAAGTYVVNERVGSTRSLPVLFPIPAGYEYLVSTLDTSLITERQYAVIRAVLRRARTMEKQARFRTTSTLGDQVLGLLNHRPTVPMDPETFLVCVCAAYQRREGGLAAVGWQQFEGLRYTATR